MTRIPLGRTPHSVSRLGLGLAALGRPGYINLGHQGDLPEGYGVGEMARHSHRMLDLAWDLGIRYFDAARSYGRAEEFLGAWLAARRPNPESLTVGSKWGYEYRADWQVQAEVHEQKSHTVERLERQWAESQTLLGPHLDLYQIHSATRASGVLRDQAVLSRLAELRADGVAIGLSTSGTDQADTLYDALEIEADGLPLFAAVQVTWNLLERAVAAAAAAAHAAGVAVLVKEALANGRLTPRNSSPTFASQLRRLDQIAAAHGCTSDAVALAAALQQPWATVVLSGAARAAHLRSNADALQLTLSTTELEALEPLTELSPAYWTTRAALEWN